MEVDRLPPYKGCAAHRAQTNCRSSCSGNNRRVFRLPRRSIKDASVARFASLSLSPHKPNSGENPRKGAAAPFLVVLRGLQRGKAPTRIQRSDSCGKRRNNGTDDACPPQAAGGMRDVEFVPTQIPLDWFPFHRQRPFPLTSKEKGAECRASGAKFYSRWLLHPSPLVLS